MSNSKTQTRFVLAFPMTIAFVSLVGVVGLMGCAKNDTGSNVAKAKSTSEKADTTELSAGSDAKQDQQANGADSKLTGLWLGGGFLDEAKLQAKLNAQTPDQQNLTIARARTFLSTAMAIDFRKDGSVENEIELVTTDGQTIREGSTGAWKVVEVKEGGLMVETQENLVDGTISTNRGFYQFDNNDQFRLAVPVSPELEGCNAMMVFARKTLSPQPVNIAEAPNQTENR